MTTEALLIVATVAVVYLAAATRHGCARLRHLRRIDARYRTVRRGLRDLRTRTDAMARRLDQMPRTVSKLMHADARSVPGRASGLILAGGRGERLRPPPYIHIHEEYD